MFSKNKAPVCNIKWKVEMQCSSRTNDLRLDIDSSLIQNVTDGSFKHVLPYLSTHSSLIFSTDTYTTNQRCISVI